MTKRWRLQVEDSFRITGRGLAVVGPFEGVGQQGDSAVVRVGDDSFAVPLISFETLSSIRSRRSEISILLRGVGKDTVIPPGSVVESID